MAHPQTVGFMFLEKVFHFIIFLGPLVFFHELGHFLFARFAGVRVEVFSIGFGPKLFKKKFGDTEYAVSLIPLGGYVKMFGDNPLDETELTDEEKAVAYTHKSNWRKFWIVFGGPLANFLLAYAIYFFLVMSGEKVPEARIGFVPEDTRYHSIGLRTGDVLKKVNDSKILSFDDLNMVDSTIKTITVSRLGKSVELETSMKGMDFLQDFSKIRSGLRIPIVLDNNGKEFFVSPDENVDFSQSLESYKGISANTLFFYPVKSDITKLNKLESIELDKENVIIKNIKESRTVIEGVLDSKFYPRDLMIENVVMGTPADQANLKKGNIILKVNNEVIFDFEGLRSRVSKTKDGESISLVVLEDGKILEKSILPKVTEQNVKIIGVQSGIVFLPLNMVIYKAEGLLDGVISAYNRTLDGIAKTFDGFKKLLFGEVSIKHLGGPFTIGKVASDSFNIGASMFLRLMAIISINLGLINLFPIPVLDGGHIIIIFIESIIGGPIPKKKLQIAQQLGVSLLFLLIFVSLFNDISRMF
jgi:regulator of sigma E protease